ncbi:coordinator of PRMT5 and differentiation stimulator isoform X2 [Taeniopygia guttata]|uniref:coordinator of PRMT5 and differentiation stimulator isoform X2 n=1 Tax=Taeniopygia guttata TaxID=59729 RepID=UPI003BB88940
MAAASGTATSEGKQLPSKRETMVWKPRKECFLQNIPNVPDGKSEESESTSTAPNEDDVSGSTDEGWYNIYADLDVWDSEVSNVPESSGQQDASEHEVEDWDKELEESTCGPYGNPAFAILLQRLGSPVLCCVLLGRASPSWLWQSLPGRRVWLAFLCIQLYTAPAQTYCGARFNSLRDS